MQEICSFNYIDKNWRVTQTYKIKTMSLWNKKPIRGVLLDITGVLFESAPGGGVAIPGSAEAVKRLKASGIALRFCTNETTTTRKGLLDKLRKMGFDMNEQEVFPPIPAICKVLKQRSLRPHLLVAPDSLPDFAEVDVSNPNCVVLGDAQHEYTYENLNKAFRVLLNLEKPVLFGLGGGRYYKENNELVLDVAPYMKALEHACDVKGEIVGKPSATFYNTVLQDMGVPADQCVMVGDDIVGDVGGAQAVGMRGVQVRTGKYRPSDENHPTVKADGFVDNLSCAVDMILEQYT